VIPYTTEPRADSGVSNVTMGIWLFLASEVMLFGALFSSYALLRIAAPDWPSGREALSLSFGLANTLVLVLATLFVLRARAATGGVLRRNLWISITFAALFLIGKSLEWRQELALGLLPSTSTFFATYFTLTGLHAAHVAAGIVANAWVATGLARVGDRMTAGRVRAVALYWVFVDLIWLIILFLMYLT
jgi:heme/copper-type cytochrome/quinol oxidase subunit 3